MTSTRAAVVLLLIAGGCLLAIGVIGPQDLLSAAAAFARGLQTALLVMVDALGTGPHLWATLGVSFVLTALLLLALGGKKSARRN